MESNIDIKELWNRQTVPAADQSEILNKISRFRKNGLKKGIFLDVILVLTILFYDIYLDLFQTAILEY